MKAYPERSGYDAHTIFHKPAQQVAAAEFLKEYWINIQASRSESGMLPRKPSLRRAKDQ
jgi:hypothetical protein